MENTKQIFSRIFIILCAGSILAGCISPAWKEPVPVDKVDFKSLARTQTNGDVIATVAAPSKEEAELLFGTSVYADRIQPIWIEIDNRSNRNYVLMKVGIDRMHYSPLEVSYQRHSGSKETKLEMDHFFRSIGFNNPVKAGTVTSGFVFTTIDEGNKAINIDLISDQQLKTFSFVIKVPGLVTDSSQRDFNTIYDKITNIEDEQELITVLESFPCCTANEAGDQWGDPLNVVMIGKQSDIFAALIRRSWHQTEVTHGASFVKTVKSFLFGSKYLYSPISPLYVFGRSQDIGLQKARESISLRNHMRVWRTPYNYQGKPIYLGQISRDIGVKFNKRTITTHVIDPDVDDTRATLTGSLAYSQALVKVGFVKGSQKSSFEDTYYNLTPDPYYSDGFRVVLFFDNRPTTLDQIELLDWEKTRLHKLKEKH